MEILKQRLLEVYKKIGLEYSKDHYIKAGLGIEPHIGFNIETGFSVLLQRGNKINYVLLGLEASTQWDEVFEGKHPDELERPEEYFRKWLNPCMSVAIYLADRDTCPFIREDGFTFTPLISGEFMHEVHTEIFPGYSKMELEPRFPPRLMGIYWERPCPQHTHLTPEQIIKEFRIEEVITEIEQVSEKIDRTP